MGAHPFRQPVGAPCGAVQDEHIFGGRKPQPSPAVFNDRMDGLIQTLRQCGSDPNWRRVMRQALGSSQPETAVRLS